MMLVNVAEQLAFGDAIANRLAELAALSDEPGRLTRLYLGPAHRRATDLVAYWMRDAGMSVRVDPLASVVGRYEAHDGGANTLLLGSHIDSVRNAGRFDGPLGVVTAIEVVKAAFKSGKRFPFAIEVIAFGDEEGVRFASTLGGSRALAGTFDDKALDELDENAISRREALTDFGCDPSRLSAEKRPADRCIGYVEVHIEQGPVLEQEGLPLGIVTAIDGITRGTVDVEGIAGHAGTVPMSMRNDALSAAAEMLLAVEQRARTRANLGGDRRQARRAAVGAPIPSPDASASRWISAALRMTSAPRPWTTSKRRSRRSRSAAACGSGSRRAIRQPRRIATRGCRISSRPPRKLAAKRPSGCRAAPATTPWRSTKSFRSPCCLCAVAAVSATTRTNSPRPPTSTSPRGRLPLSSTGSKHHDHASHQGPRCRVGKGAKRRAHAVRTSATVSAWASLRSAHPTRFSR